ncbi:MAG: formyltetrahydrofolate deformylase [Cyanobacteria bacterium]|nr:formyltetrahydrofolate deformylase [Cyanobacteriota bacterium]MDA1020098.1 formyltetrahydrofolate deformylase [Cyanobacteriota bacterium]
MAALKLLISCPDQKGIVYELTKFIAENDGNIIDSQQHSMDDKFFMRLEIDSSNFKIDYSNLEEKFKPLADRFDMDFKFSLKKKNMAMLVSKHHHCLNDILLKHKYGVIDVDIPVIISNHPEAEEVAALYGIKFHHCPIINKDKVAQEAKILEILQPLDIDFIVMARYMQILSEDFINQYSYNIINVHHSFLPSFKGANPYHQAYEKGVKIIGATAHYATADLDMGPIIAQDVTTVNYKDTANDYVSKGRDIEELVFSRAIKAHSEDKIIVFDNKTIVFH